MIKILSKYPIVYLSYTMDLLPKLYTREDLMSCKQVQDFKYVPYSVKLAEL